jgi:hypothetical protein
LKWQRIAAPTINPGQPGIFSDHLISGDHLPALSLAEQAASFIIISSVVLAAPVQSQAALICPQCLEACSDFSFSTVPAEGVRNDIIP